MRCRLLAATLATLSLAVAAGCAAEDDRLVVLAAASLTDVLPAIGDAFERETGMPVVVSTAGSQQLLAQVRDGAPADVFVPADPAFLETVDVTAVLPFAATEQVIAVAAGNPLRIGRLADLARAEVTVVLAAPAVPAGRYAREVLEAAGVSLSPASLEPDVRSALARVVRGDADAAIVYASDVVSSNGAVEAVTIDEVVPPRVEYVAAALTRAPRPQAAAAFVEFLATDRAIGILRAAGFRSP